jgi:peptidoglycan/LPS O-acetylase OafA/YrhL
LILGWKSILGISNIALYQASADYFGQSTALNPFTHTWSLGVEEQFYLIFPFIFWFTGYGKREKKGERLFITCLTTLAFVSLSLSFCFLIISLPPIT